MSHSIINLNDASLHFMRLVNFFYLFVLTSRSPGSHELKTKIVESQLKALILLILLKTNKKKKL